jgi:sugar phosphate isomerase/epimerase
VSGIDRRKFLRAAGVAAAGLAAAGTCASEPVAAQSPQKAGAPGAEGMRQEHPAGEKEPRLLVGCCAISYSKYLKGGQMTMEDFIRKGVELRLDGVDMTVYFLKSTEPAYLANLRHLAFKNGLGFSGAACGSSMVQTDKEKRAQVLADIKKWTDVTDELGASHLRIFAGKLPDGVTTEQATNWCVEIMKEASDYSGKRGITLGIEPHGGITQRADTLLEIIRRVDSPYAGINLDITHFIPTPEQSGYAQIEMCIPYATQTHIRYRFDSGELIDLDRVWQMFAKGGYKGYMSAEYENEKEDAITGVPRLIGDMRKLSRKYSSV